jgi:UDP-2,3-diacylglucosamine pyrophosphatase LpxH
MQRKALSVIISDLHLGNKQCQHENLLSFLKSFESDDGHSYNLKTLYLNGDIIDITQFDYKIFFTSHRTIIKKFLRMADKGVKIVYVGGNHEAPIRKDIFSEENHFNGIDFCPHAIFETKNGKRYLVIHGDQFDGIVNMHPIIYKLGDIAYNLMHVINGIQNQIRKWVGLQPFSFAHWIKTKAKSAVKFVADFENIIANYARKYNVDGVMAGHIHVPEDRMIDGIHYLNSGTWCEICSAIIEDEEGNISVQRFD